MKCKKYSNQVFNIILNTYKTLHHHCIVDTHVAYLHLIQYLMITYHIPAIMFIKQDKHVNNKADS